MNFFFILSFIPALAYWLIEIFYSEQQALMAGVILAVLEVSLEKIFTKKVHSLSILNGSLMFILGGMGYFFKEGILFKLQPTFTGVIFFIALFFKTKRGESFFLEILEEMGRNVPPLFVKETEKNLGFFMLIYGLLMAFIAFYFSTGIWLFFKTGGFYIASFLFILGNTFYLRKRLLSCHEGVNREK